MICPNQFPDHPATRRVAIIGEAPGQDEIAWRVCLKCGKGFSPRRTFSNRCPDCSGEAVSRPTPFVGASGNLLNALLAQVGIDRHACFVGNVCQFATPGGDANKLKWQSAELQTGLVQLRKDLAAFQPQFVLCLGNTPLRALKGMQKVNVGDWRGSLWLAEDVCPGMKCMATYHPAAVLREMELSAIVRFDLRRMAEEMRTDGLEVTQRMIEVDLTHKQLMDRLAGLHGLQGPVSVDIEGGCDWIECIGFAVSPTQAFVVPFIHTDGSSVWTEEEEIDLWTAVQGVLERQEIPKILQNSLYDAFVLAWTLGITIRNIADDTMLKHWELYCELPKSLGFQASIYTKETFYKAERKSTDYHTFLTYCGKDCCVTYECNDALNQRLQPGQLKHYQFNLQLLVPLLYMELRGIRYDHAQAKKKLKTIQRHIYRLQDLLNRAASVARRDLHELDRFRRQSVVSEREDKGVVEGAVDPFVQLVASCLCKAKPRRVREWDEVKTFKNGKPPRTVHKRVSEPVVIRTLEDCSEFVLDSQRDTMHHVQAIARRGDLTSALRGELSELLDCHVKVNSTGASGDACWFLYEVCGFDKQYQKEGNRLTDKLATDDEALIKIWVAEGKKPQAWTASPVKLAHRGRLALAFLKLRRLITQTKTLRVSPDPDGRMRCAYNVVGTETGRLTCYESPTGSGFNLQTVTKRHRVLFLADPGKLLGQRDLAGADGWTVAAYAAMHGDRTMLEDYRNGLKPAKITARIYESGPQVNRLDRAQLKEECKQVSQDGWLYAATKQVQHGCYTADHEVLTQNGWVRFDDYVCNPVPVLVYENDTRDAWFEQPVEVQHFLYTGSLFTFKGSSIDLTVTSEHTIPFTTNGNPKFTTASEMAKRGDGTKIPTACKYQGGSWSVGMSRLVAAYQADGHLHKKGHVSFHFKKLRKVERLKQLLQECELEFSCNQHADGSYYFHIPRKSAFKFTEWGKSAGPQMLEWQPYTLLNYLDEHRYWDGSIGEGIKCHLSSKDPEHIQWLDTLLHLSLQNGSFQKSQISGFGTLMHKLNYNRRTFADLGSMRITEQPVTDHPVYCVTVSTGFIAVRRGGKIVMSGNSSYKMGKRTMSNNILILSWKLSGKPIFVSEATCESIQRSFFTRYWGIPRWHAWMEQQLKTTGCLITSDGFKRQFFGRKDDYDTLKQALAHMPQYYTTRSTTMALLRLWTDPENRLPDGSLREEPLHTVHDSLVTQFPEGDVEWSKRKGLEWFNNPVLIAQETITIPFEMGVGEDWKNLEPV